jgi:hypothetical protein
MDMAPIKKVLTQPTPRNLLLFKIILGAGLIVI